MKYTREQIEGFAREAEVLATDPAFSSGSPDWVISRNKHAAAMLRQLLSENDALREDAERWKVADACSAVVSDSGGGFFYQILIPFQGNLWRREGNQNDFFREDIDAARKKG